jgi:hypothetical protein
MDKAGKFPVPVTLWVSSVDQLEELRACGLIDEMPAVRTCEHCGESFAFGPGTKHRATARFCSRPHMAAAAYLRRKGVPVDVGNVRRMADTDDRARLAAAMRKAGRSVTEIAAELGRSRLTIYSHLHRAERLEARAKRRQERP